MEPLFYRPAEAAEAFRVSRSKVYELMNRAEIPWVRVRKIRPRARGGTSATHTDEG